VRQWIGEARVDADTLVWREDWPAWRRAEEVFAELTQSRAAAFPAFVDIPDLSTITGKGLPVEVSTTGRELPSGFGKLASGRRGNRSRHAPSASQSAKRLVVLLSLIVTVLAAALVFVVVYFGQH
jgi:hypothetical protein